jgi:hypothetical protein
MHVEALPIGWGRSELEVRVDGSNLEAQVPPAFGERNNQHHRKRDLEIDYA